jgi:hypothetical protein
MAAFSYIHDRLEPTDSALPGDRIRSLMTLRENESTPDGQKSLRQERDKYMNGVEFLFPDLEDSHGREADPLRAVIEKYHVAGFTHDLTETALGPAPGVTAAAAS